MATVVTPGADVIEMKEVVESTQVVAPKEKDATDELTSKIVLYSFVAAVALAIGGFVVVAVYLFRYLNHAFLAFSPDAMQQLSGMTPQALQPILLARAGLWKFILQSCGIVSGVAFGFLGFALFLLGVKGDMDASFDNVQHKVQLSRMAPGSFVILIAAVLIGICSINKVELNLDSIVTTTETRSSGGGQNPELPVAAQAGDDPATDANALPPGPSGKGTDKAGGKVNHSSGSSKPTRKQGK